MDTVRFGRVLGQGARHAAKTLVSAVDAATAPHPDPAAPTPVAPRSTAPSTRAATSPRPSPPASGSPSQAQSPTGSVLPPSPSRKSPIPGTTTRGLAEGSRRFGRAVWAPAVRLSGVLWLELTGVFFGLFALVAAIAAWHLRSAFHALPASPVVSPPSVISASPVVSASDDRTRLLFAAGMILLFGYFSLSSFLKANRRSRRP